MRSVQSVRIGEIILRVSSHALCLISVKYYRGAGGLFWVGSFLGNRSDPP